MDVSASSQLLLVLVASLFVLAGSCYADDDIIDDTNIEDGANLSQLTLDIYVDDTGKALVTGYAEYAEGWSFLETSQYQYENDTSQLYAITNSLTWKRENDWGITFAADARYGEYHTTFYLPSDVKLGRINGSEGLEYFVSASNDSFVVEFYGYDVESPTITIEYRQPLQERVESNNEDAEPSTHLPIIIAALVLALLFTIVAIRIVHKERAGPSPSTVPIEPTRDGTFAEPVQESDVAEPVQEPGVAEPVLEKDSIETISEQKQDADVSVPQTREEAKEIEITSEMAAVMETLTARERSVLNTLIDHRGRITQAEIRYETRIPKSSLTGIIYSLERRKIITKKEWGRTNIIELSEWFKSGKKSD